MKINYHKILTKDFNPELHFFINVPISDVDKYGDNIWEELSKEFVKYAKTVQKYRWIGIDKPIVDCEECLSQSSPIIIESEKYVEG